MTLSDIHLWTFTVSWPPSNLPLLMKTFDKFQGCIMSEWVEILCQLFKANCQALISLISRSPNKCHCKINTDNWLWKDITNSACVCFCVCPPVSPLGPPSLLKLYGFISLQMWIHGVLSMDNQSHTLILYKSGMHIWTPMIKSSKYSCPTSFRTFNN